MSALIAGVGFLPHAQSPGSDHIELVFSPFALWIAAVSSSRRTTFLLDKQGITLGRRTPFRKPQFVPWDDVVAVDWSFESQVWGRRSTLEVLRRRGPRPGVAQPVVAPELDDADATSAPEADPGHLEPFPSTTRIARETTMSRVDPIRLATALDALAPAVRHFGDLGDLAIRRADITAAARELGPEA